VPPSGKDTVRSPGVRGRGTESLAKVITVSVNAGSCPPRRFCYPLRNAPPTPFSVGAADGTESISATNCPARTSFELFDGLLTGNVQLNDQGPNERSIA
jgi:hypothetical protein